MVSADVPPPQDGETDEQRIQHETANATRAVRRQEEIDATAAAAGQLTGNVVLGVGDQPASNVRGQAPAALAAHQWQDMNLDDIIYAPETF
jgi:hypothetical protein